MGKPDIIYEDNDIIVCYKPAGIATQTRRIGQQDMESFIRNYRAAKNEPPYVGIVHRLDQPVEGVMVFAKNQKAAASLSRQIKEHTTEKYYRAASRGQGVSGADKEEDNKEDNHDLHGILSQIISLSTSVPIHLKSQAKKTGRQKKQCFSTG